MLAGCLLAASCTATVSGNGTSASGPTATTTRNAKPTSKLTWTPCHDDYECATLPVPLDWFNDNGKTIDLAVVRQPSTGSQRVGSLLLNPGGPGQSGVDFLTQFNQLGEFPADVTDRFDLVSWDPRGTGESDPIDCLDEQDMLEAEPLPLPAKGEARDKVAKKLTEQIETCIRDAPDLAYVGTKQTARDLDALRDALGDDKLNYVGFSYGTSIGLQYLKDQPDRVRAMVLDGVVVPGTDPVASTKRQIQSFEDNLDLFLDDCKKRASCTFGDGDPRKALRAFLDELGEGKRLPADYQLPDDTGEMHRRKGTVGLSEALQGILLTLYGRDSWAYLEVALTRASDPDNPDASYLLMFRDQLRGRELDGTWNDSSAANLAINCADQRQRSKGAFGDLSLVGQWSKTMPFFGEFGALGLPGCYLWPEARWPLEAVTAKQFTKVPPILLVNATHDAATPYANAKEIAELLPESSLITVESENHTSFAQGEPCVDAAVADYLLSGRLPAKPSGPAALGHPELPLSGPGQRHERLEAGQRHVQRWSRWLLRSRRLVERLGCPHLPEGHHELLPGRLRLLDEPARRREDVVLMSS